MGTLKKTKRLPVMDIKHCALARSLVTLLCYLGFQTGVEIKKVEIFATAVCNLQGLRFKHTRKFIHS